MTIPGKGEKGLYTTPSTVRALTYSTDPHCAEPEQLGWERCTDPFRGSRAEHHVVLSDVNAHARLPLSLWSLLNERNLIML